MAKKKRSKRESSAIPSSPSLTKLPALKPFQRPVLSHELRAVEDRRTFHPLGRVRPARMTNGVTSKKLKPTVQVRRGQKVMGARVAFSAPKKVIVCVRRAVRRGVIFALGKFGKGHGGGSRRRTYYSGVSCK